MKRYMVVAGIVVILGTLEGLAVPGMPVLLCPAAGTCAERRPTISWTLAASTLQYKLVITRSGAPYLEKWTPKTSYKSTVDIPEGTYDIRVIAYDGANYGAWSPTVRIKRVFAPALASLNGLSRDGGNIDLVAGYGIELEPVASNLTVVIHATGDFSEGPVTAASFSGDGNALSNLNGAAIAGGTVGNAQLADNAVDANKVVDGSVGNEKLANSAVTVLPGPGLTGGGTVSLGGSITLTNIGILPKGSVYRWTVFHNYDYSYGPMMGNNPAMFGGVPATSWSAGGGVTAASLSSDKEVLRTLYTNKGYGGKNAHVYSRTEYIYSTADSETVTALFRIKNTTDSAINWIPYLYYTCYSSWSQYASVALNGAHVWYSAGGSGQGSAAITLSIPAGRTSTVIFISGMGLVSGNVRSIVLGFFNNSLQLPAGLEYADDLDSATGGWEQ